MNCIRPSGRVQRWNADFCFFKPDTLTYINTLSITLYYNLSCYLCKRLSTWERWGHKLLPKFSENLFWQICSCCAIFSAKLFYKMRLIRSSQAEFGQKIHLYTTSSRRLGQLMYISASYGVHVNASCNVHELYALVNDRMSSRPRPQSITGTKTRL